MKRIVAALVLATLATGCQGNLARGREELTLDTRDFQAAYDVALGVLERYFTVASANYAQGTIVTEPQMYEGGNRTLADLVGQKGPYRRTVRCEVSQGMSGVVAAVAVEVERDSTAQAAAAADMAPEDPTTRVPDVGPRMREPGPSRQGAQWVLVGYDEALARELLGEMAAAFERSRSGEVTPDVGSPREIMQESQRLGAEMGL